MDRALRYVLVLGLLIGWAHLLAAAEPDVPANVNDLMQDRKYAEAITAIDKLLAEKKLPADQLLYLKGRAQHLVPDYDAAIATFDLLLKEHAKSTLARRARFAKGVALARKGDFRAAEVIYKAEAQNLLSLDRKQEIANIYLEFAEGYFKPAKPDVAPDYAKALEFYTQALDVGPQPEKRIELELRIAECKQNLGQFAEAATLLTKFIKDHPQHTLLIEGRYRLGECQLAQGQLAAARRTWQDLLQLHVDAMSERLPEAAFRLSETYQLPNPPHNEDLTQGIATLNAFLEKYPEHKLAGEAHQRIVSSYINRGRYEDAIAAAKKFLADERYVKRDEVPAVRNLLGLAYKVQGKFDEALAAYADFLAKHPTHQAWSQVQQEIINVEYLKAQAAFDAKKYNAARELWTAFLAKYPLDPRNPGIMYRFGQMKFQEGKWEEANTAWRQLVAKYPNTNESSQAQYMIAATLEEKLGQYEESLKEYRKLTWGSYVSNAHRRVSRLTAKTMTLSTERVVRSGETPYLSLTSRNIEAVTVRVYAVDLETYFRKMHLAQGIEQLDISLIDPDASFEYKVPDYQAFQQYENRIEVQLPKKGDVKDLDAGVMAVTVSSKTLEATTLVLQSDLDIVVKSSRDELFVFAENLKTGKPWPNARILISNGQKVFAEGTTGDDGVFHKAFKELADSEDVRVFAISGKHTASNMVGLNGVGVSEGLTDKGYIYTDRPAYRAGNMVHLRGVRRKVSDDKYTVAQGKKYQVEVFDNRNRLVFDKEVALSAFGSFHEHFSLPLAAPQGEYRILVHDKDRESYEGSFLVHEYQLEPVRFEVETPRTVYYRGEEITGKIKASYYYGAPLAGKEIRYHVGDGPVETATTDDKGEVAFKLPTREYREAQMLTLTIEMPDRSLTVGKTFFLETQAFTLTAKTVRPVYLAGETFDVTLLCKDALEKPITTAVTLQILKQTKVDGQTGEVEIAKHELKTDEKEGLARKTIHIDEGGKYILRVSGIDRFKNNITRDTLVRISDDKDATRLRILADQHTFKAGDTANVVLHWRDDPALALITFQGARILDYKLVQLQKGVNKLEIPLTAQLAPNFELAVAVMTDARLDPKAKRDADGNLPTVIRFHEAASPFTVARDLRVAVAYKLVGDVKRALIPGDEVEATVTTTDSQGKPLSAEVSLALIEQSLLERFGWPMAPISEFFRDQERVSAMRTTSSVTFTYHPATKPINPRLLAEKDRLEIAEEEARRLSELATTVENMNHDMDMFAEEASIPFDDRDPFAAPAAIRLRAADVDAAAIAVELSDFVDVQQRQELLNVGPGVGGPGPGVLTLGANVHQSTRAWQRLGRSMKGQGLDGRGAADFDSLIELTKQSVNTQTWQAGGVGEGTIAPYPTNLSIIVRPGPDADLPALTHWGMQANGEAKKRLGLYFGNSVDGTATLNGQQLLAWYENEVRDVQVIRQDGTAVNYNLYGYFNGRFDNAKAEQFVALMQKEGAVVLPQFAPQETGYWNPDLTTDATGKATVRFTLPDRSTAWTLLAKAITADTLAGEAEAKFAVKKELFGQLKLPLAFTDGDAARIQASIHNDALEAGEIDVALKTTLGGKTTTLNKKVKISAKGIIDVDFEQEFKLPDDAPRHGAPTLQAELELTITAGDKTDVVKRVVPVEPYGVAVYGIAGGTAQGDSTVAVAPPKGMTLVAPRLQVIVGPTVEQSLLDAIFAPATWCQLDAIRVASSTDTAASDLLAALALQQLLGKSRDANNPQATEIDARIRSAVTLLTSLQNDDGGWSWGGKGGSSDRIASARVLWAISAAKAAGYRVTAEEFGKGVNYLQTELTAIKSSDYETRAVLLLAVTMAGKEDVTLANQLYRNRQSLSPMAVVQLALTFVQMDRKQTAAEMLTLLDNHNFDQPTADGKQASHQSGAELRALYALALDHVSPTDAKLTTQIDWLMAHRTGHRWSPDKATGPAMQVLCRWYARTKFQGEKYKLTIFVNDLLAQEVEFDAEARTQTLNIAEKFLKLEKPDQRVRFEITGRGRFTYQCALGGFVPSDKLASTTSSYKVERFYEPAQLELYGETIPRGFDVIAGAVQPFRNELNELPVAKRGRVELHITRPGLRADTADDLVEYLVVTEPVPAGATVIENTITGEFDRYELTPGGITFYVGARRQIGVISYDVHGYLPGKYRTTPTVVRNAYRADQIAVASPKALTVLELGAKSGDKYRNSPRELYELGQRHFSRGELALAAPPLQELFNQWSLGGDYYKETARMLLDVSLAADKPADVVKYFEIIIEKFPDVELSFAKFMQAGEAYHKIGEYERSYLVFRAVIEASFLRESRVAGFLQGQGEFLRSVDVMSNLLAEYPTEPYVAAAAYALAQNIYAKAPEASADAKLREKHVTRVDLIRQAWRRLDQFLTENPNDPAADQASFSIANALLDLELYEKAIERCQKFASRYPDSDFVDSYWYIIGFCHYARGESAQALEMCKKVAESKRIEKGTGRMIESPNKWQAIYILGQIHHSLGEAEAAMREYARVKDRFEDAREAIEFFAAKGIKLPEVTTIKPGDATQLELKYRNIPTVDVTVYRIDLMKFSLLRRSLQEITQINLAGIRPIHEETVKLGDGKDFREKTEQLKIPVKEEGAYLVVCRGGDLYSSGMVVISPLVAEVQEEVEAGRVRTTIRDVVKDSYVHGVHVKVIGSRNTEFVSGETDLRGIHIADGIQGEAMVIAQAEGGRYAFFRGTRDLGPPPPAPNEPAQQQAGEPAKPALQTGKDALLNDVKTFNKSIQMEQQKNLENVYDNGINGGFGGGLGGGVF